MKAVIFANVATKWGLTEREYKTLVQLHQNFKDNGLVVLGFPCNQFGGQEPGTNIDIKLFARDVYKANFPMMAKTEVNGQNTNDIYRYLRLNSSLKDKE